VTSAARLCKPRYCWAYRFDGKLIHFAAEHGLSLEYIEAIRRRYPLPPGRASAAARAVLTGTVAEIPDVQADPDYEHGDDAKTMDFRSLLAVPMLKNGHVLGAIVLARTQPGRFPGQQVELLRTLAAQAVIAIENVRLFEAEQQRTGELSQSLEQQTATADVLEVISRSRLRTDSWPDNPRRPQYQKNKPCLEGGEGPAHAEFVGHGRIRTLIPIFSTKRVFLARSQCSASSGGNHIDSRAKDVRSTACGGSTSRSTKPISPKRTTPKTVSATMPANSSAVSMLPLAISRR
jgi:GAF domain